MLKVKVIVGSTRQGRYSDKPANWVMQELQKHDNVEAELLDLRDFPMPFFEDAIPPLMAKQNYTNEVVKKWADKIAEAEAFIIVSPEYNHAYPAVLKNALDYVYYEWNKKPVGFVSYGSAAGTRVVEQLKLVVSELQMYSIKNAIHIPWNTYLATVQEQVPLSEEAIEKLRQGSGRYQGFFDELIELGNQLKK